MAIHSDMQGPCPDGFHIMTKDELTALNTAWNYFVNTSSGMVSVGDFYKYLKMPLSGARNSSGTINSVGTGGMYWTSSAYSATGAYRLYITASSVDSTGSGNRANGFSIRPVKDEAVTSFSGRTKLLASPNASYAIYRNSSLGLIGIAYSNGGAKYITIADKNLGATTVWNDGDTLSGANCGKYYQRGNNRGHARTGTISTSSTKVDASNYGPGNYYDRSAFIKTTNDRSSVRNDNLRGGETQGTWSDIITYSVYDRWAGQTIIYQGECSNTDTIGDILSDVLTPNYGITNISETLGDSPLGSSVLIKNTNGIFYDATPGPGCHLEGDYSAMQGPAPDGYHVPSKDEWVALCGILTTTFSMTKGSTTMATYLKMPRAGARFRSSADADNQDFKGYYWSSTRWNYNLGYSLYFYSSDINPAAQMDLSNAYSIRCFKNSPVIPDNNWTILYDGSSVATGAGVFYNSTLGLISVSGDGANWITIQDKNLGATTVYNSGDNCTQANCGKYYQWGNNYGFPWDSSATITTSSTLVNASNYGPGNYYSSSTFIIRDESPYGWDDPDNADLWGGETGVIYTEVCPTYKLHGHIGTWHMEWVPEEDYSAMRGPCPEGFHIPLNTEWQAAYNIRTILGGGSSDGTNFGIALKLPFAGERLPGNSNVSYQEFFGCYWSSIRSNENDAYFLDISSSLIAPQDSNIRSSGYSVRCFKDIPVIPTSSWTKLYGTSIEAGGIFGSSSLGLISMSSDGTTWITIADKNVGATTVWNSGDTLSETNCGKYYQWGNNYGFPRTGSVTTSGTQVDASNYGPGNYYFSSTFITRSSSPYGWDSSNNGNLWGGETGVVQTGHYKRRTGPARLKSYQEIVAMATDETSTFASALAELNTHPSEYYNKLSSEGYITTSNGIAASKNDTINEHRFGSVSYGIKYNNGTWIRYNYGSGSAVL